MKFTFAFAAAAAAALTASAIDHAGIASREIGDGFAMIANGRPVPAIIVGDGEDSAVKIAAANLAKDFERVTGAAVPSGGATAIIAKVDPALKGKRET